ncbi:hypothetical protein LO772_31355 [Yinghuangia sp. ASG 101]|uniref:hypothetical protein n=1 Tax=Yinghuangia sp. ASG 101 TaxID=2896848 RepID=UPI001E369CC2|nr:hypothetical protein [Yinghuangia sp. ASG 101]UGQ11250.1 hypothetical protein LO772_31355 [Yinghuangia sp. ASG 101]
MLELHGWGDLVDDQVLNAFAVVAEPQHMAASIRDCFDGLVDRVSFSTAYDIDTRVWDDVVQDLKGGGA